MSPKYLTFDCYGTLIDWRAGIESSLGRALGEPGLGGKQLLDAYVAAEMEEEKSYKPYRKVLERAAVRASRSLGREVTPEAAAAFADSVPRWPAFQDTSAALEELGKRGYRRYILSNVDDDQLRDTVEHHGLKLDGFVTAQQVGSYKPRPGHWLKFMEVTGAGKEDVLHVAQSLIHDIVPTQELGIASAWVNRYREPLPKGVQPRFIVDSLAGLVEAMG